MPARKDPSEIQPSFIKGGWDLGEASGSRADSSGNSRTLTDNNTVLAREGFRQARSAYFNSANSEYFSLAHHADFNFGTGEFSVFSRIKMDDTTARWIISKNGNAWGVYYTGSEVALYINGSAVCTTSTGGALGSAKWFDIGVRRKGGYASIWVNGFRATAETSNSANGDSSSSLLIGQGQSTYWNGQMEKVYIWSTGLTDSQMSSMSTISDIFGRDTGGEEHLRSSASLNVKMAQSFNPRTTGYFDAVIMNALRNNSPTGNVWVTIETDSGGAPSGIAVATSEMIDVSLISTSASYPELAFRFTNAFQLTGGTTYWIVVQGDYSVSSTVGLRFVRSSGGAGNYTGGAAYTYNGTSWSAISTDDFSFRLCRITGNLIDSHFLEAGSNDYGELDSNNNNQRYAQNIKFTSDKTIKGIAVWMNLYGSPSGTAVIKIYSNNAGSPGTLLATSNSFNRNIGYKTGSPSTRENGGLWYFEFASAFTISANTEYFISIESSSGGSGANYNMMFLTGGSGYTATYDMQKYNGGSWSTYSSGYDMQFALFEDIAAGVGSGNFFLMF